MTKLPGTLAFTILVSCGCGLAQSTEGLRVFEQTCTTCHGKAQIPPIPDPTALRQMAGIGLSGAQHGCRAPRAANHRRCQACGG